MTRADLPRGLGWRRALARAALLWEQVWPALFPALCVLGGALLLALSDLLPRLPVWLYLLVLAGIAAAVALLLWRGLRRCHLPGNTAADRRLERDSGLSHRPLQALTDRPAAGDAGFWAAHLARAETYVRHLRLRWPRAGLVPADPFAIRAALLVALVAAFTITGHDTPHVLRRAMLPAVSVQTETPLLEAWIAPPAYTGLAPVSLPAAGGDVSVPAGSRLSVSMTGSTATPTLHANATPIAVRPLDARSFAAEQTLAASTTLRIQSGGHDVVWRVTVQDDTAPRVTFPAPPGAAERGLKLRLPWQAVDDWGIVALVVELHLQEKPDDDPLILDVPLPAGSARDIRGTLQSDLTAHPWAGLPVVARLRARDAAGQEGISDEAAFDLPERTFIHPVARVLVDIRRALSVRPDRRAAIRQLDEVNLAPSAYADDAVVYLGVQAARSRLRYEREDDTVANVQALLWELALRVEEGVSARTAQALDDARAQMRDTLQTPGADAQQALQDLRGAITRHLEALQQEDVAPPDAARREVTRRLEALRDALQEQRPADAERQMAELDALLDQLQDQQAGSPEQQRNAERRQRGERQMSVMDDLVQREARLMGNSQTRSLPDLPLFRPPGAQPAQPVPERAVDLRRQQALRRALGEVMQQYGDLMGEIPQHLSDADRAMVKAAEALAAARDEDARVAQRRAVEALLQGSREMSRQMAQQPGGQGGQRGREQQASGNGSSRTRGENRDPLGRDTGSDAGADDEGSDTAVPDRPERQRARAIQEELRRRGADRTRPAQELDYIERLLKRF